MNPNFLIKEEDKVQPSAAKRFDQEQVVSDEGGSFYSAASQRWSDTEEVASPWNFQSFKENLKKTIQRNSLACEHLVILPSVKNEHVIFFNYFVCKLYGLYTIEQ